MKNKTLLCIFPLLLFCMLDAAEVDPGKSQLAVWARSAEAEGPVLDEPLALCITLKDSSGNPLSGISGSNISLFIEAAGTITEKILSGKTGRDGKIFTSFSPVNVKSGSNIKFAVNVNDVLLQNVSTITYNNAAESVGPAQVLWNGSVPLYRNQKIGQTFICGDISAISRIKVMLNGSSAAGSEFPLLKLYEWDTDYKTTISHPPLATSDSPKFSNLHYCGKNLAIYKLECPVKPGAKYYFELSFNAGPDAQNNSAEVFRTWNFPDGPTPFAPDSYQEGSAFMNGQETAKSDLVFYVFYKTDKAK